MKLNSFYKKLLVFLLLFFLALTIKDAINPTPEKQIKRKLISPRKTLRENVFDVDEVIKFGVYSHRLKVGSGELIYRGVVNLGQIEAQHIIFDLKSFSVKDKEEIFGSLDFLNPYRVDRKVRLFGRNEAIREEYDSDHKSVKIVKRINNTEPLVQQISNTNEMNNVLLLIYKLRNDQELRVGKEYKIVLPTQNFKLLVRDIRKIKVPLGLFEAFYIESKPAKYKIWLSLDPERIPLRIQGVVAAAMVYLAADEVSYL